MSTTDPAHAIAFTFNEFTYKVVSTLTNLVDQAALAERMPHARHGAVVHGALRQCRSDSSAAAGRLAVEDRVAGPGLLRVWCMR